MSEDQQGTVALVNCKLQTANRKLRTVDCDARRDGGNPSGSVSSVYFRSSRSTRRLVSECVDSMDEGPLAPQDQYPRNERDTLAFLTLGISLPHTRRSLESYLV